MNAEHWLILIISLPGQSGTPRMRVWRALKSRGAAILRDGVYVLPDTEDTTALLETQVRNIEKAGGAAYLLRYSSSDSDLGPAFLELFDRSAEYDQWISKASSLVADLAGETEAEARRKEEQLRRDLEVIAGIDYFPGNAKAGANEALREMSAAINRRFSPDEPASASGTIDRCSAADYQGRLWATRRGLWVDRVASAWLIRRFIDPDAGFLWLAHPDDCPADAVGFDFNGASFSHIGEFVTFEVLLRSFGLDRDPALIKLGTLVHYADVGGLPVADTAGFLTMLAGVKQRCADDDALLDAGSDLLDHLYAAYAESERP